MVWIAAGWLACAVVMGGVMIVAMRYAEDEPETESYRRAREIAQELARG